MAAHHLAVGLERTLGALVDVLAVVRLGGGHEHGDLLHARPRRAVEATHVGHQRTVGHPLVPLDGRRYLHVIGQRGDPARVDEARDLDALDPGRDERFDHPNLALGRQVLSLIHI